MDRSREHADAAEIAIAAGRLLLELRASGVTGGALGDVGDARAHALIAAELAARYPSDALLSEEAIDDPVRLGRDRVWIVDPLDGTREYVEIPRDDWAVHVALVVDGQPTVGAVALPARGVTLATGIAPPPRPQAGGRRRMVVSRTRPPAFTADLAAQLDADVVPTGSAGAKVAAVVLGEADLYVHAGGQHEWDSAAPVAVAAAAGFHVSRLDGSPLRYNQPVPVISELLVCRADLAERTLAALGRLGA